MMPAPITYVFRWGSFPFKAKALFSKSQRSLNWSWGLRWSKCKSERIFMPHTLSIVASSKSFSSRIFPNSSDAFSSVMSSGTLTLSAWRVSI